MTEIDLTPITRLEYDIDAILNDHAVAEPITRIELILADIVAGNTTTVVPVTRIETFLAIISGADYPVPEPVTRIETFLAIIAGENYETPEAVTRLEGLLAEWVEKGSGIWKTVSGSLIHITDALASPMQKCEVTLEPIQDLHGQDAPYPAGGGKNKFDNENALILDGRYFRNVTPPDLSTSADSACYAWLCQPNTTYTVKANASDYTSISRLAYVNVDVTTMTTDDKPTLYNVVRLNTNGKMTITTGADATYLVMQFTKARVLARDLMVQIELGSDATAYAPYSNICPITGWTGCEVVQAGENLLPIPQGRTDQQVTFTTNSDKSISLSGTATGSAYFVPSNAETTRLKAGTYKLTGGISTSIRLYVAGTYVDGTGITVSYDIGNGATVTFSKDANVYCQIYVANGTNTTGKTIYPMLSLTEQSYATPNITTLSVTFTDSAGTVYGGTYDFVSGGLKPYKEYDSYNGETLTGRWMSSMDKYVAGTTPTIGAQVVDLDSYDTTVQLTPQPISTLAGENNVWSNGDSVEITYKAQA